MAPWLTSLSPVLSQGRTMPLTFLHPIFNLFNQDSCHRHCSRNLLSCHRFQFASPERFCPLPILTAAVPMKRAALCRWADCAASGPETGAGPGCSGNARWFDVGEEEIDVGEMTRRIAQGLTHDSNAVERQVGRQAEPRLLKFLKPRYRTEASHRDRQDRSGFLLATPRLWSVHADSG